ncbi:MAG: hypothetical protein ABIT61_02660, partial [Steroidobacteraceae bacterium]
MNRGDSDASEGENAERKDEYSLRFKLKKKSGSSLQPTDQIVLFDEQGGSLNINGHYLSTNRFASQGAVWEESQGAVTLGGKPVSLVLKTIDQVETLDYRFELRIPTQQAERQPKQLEKLMFSAAAPISLKVRELIRGEPFSHVAIRVENHSNKDVDSVEFTLNHFDAMSRKLSDAPGHLMSSPSITGGSTPALVKGEAKDDRITAFFLPEDATYVTIALRGVKF